MRYGEDRRTFIKSMVNQALRLTDHRLWRQRNSQTDLEAICREKGIHVQYICLEQHESGFIKTHSMTGRIVIYINSRHPKRRQRFTLAHELGHYFLHPYKAQRYRRDLPNGAADSEEAEANLFAAELLMPDIKLRTLLAEYESYHLLDVDIFDHLTEKLSSEFGVSREAAATRLNDISQQLNGPGPNY